MIKKFKKSNVEYSDIKDDFVTDVENLIGFQKTKIIGSYIKYGKDKACDLDLSEDITNIKQDDKINILHKYFIKLNNNKDKYYLVMCYFNMEHPIIKDIYNNIGYMDGLFNIHNYNEENIIKNLKLLNQNEITYLFEKYKKDNNYLSLLESIKKKIKPLWTIDELLKGEKTYFNETFNIKTSKYNDFYIEIIYKNFRSSNYIYINSYKKIEEKYITFDIVDILHEGNIFYYYLIKKLLFFIKWLYFNKLIKEKNIATNSIDLHNEIFDFRNDIGNKYNKSCILNNNIQINKIKNIDTQNLISKYNTYINEINNICKEKYTIYTKNYQDYLKNYIRIQ